MSQSVERRSSRLRPEIRQTGETRSLTGYAAVHYRQGDADTEYVLYQSRHERIVERIMPGAFARAISEGDDVRCLINHEHSHVIGRTKAGTLTLSVDETGLRYEVPELPDRQDVRDLAVSLHRGDIDGSSFAFLVRGAHATRGKEVWREEREADGPTVYIREIHDLTLYDVSPVTYPAYGGTSVSLRAVGTEADIETLRQAARQATQRESLTAARLDLARRRLALLGPLAS